jgi:hypothetical protein
MESIAFSPSSSPSNITHVFSSARHGRVKPSPVSLGALAPRRPDMGTRYVAMFFHL